MADTVLGKVSCVPRGDYNAGTTYYALDIVGYQGGSYLAMKESTGVTPSNDQVNWMQLSGPGLPGADGTDGTDGVTFTPSVSEAGVISWTNDGGEDNPDPVNIMGPQGNPGAAAGFGEATATVDETTGTPSVEVETSGPDTAKVFSFAFSGLKGETGAKGDTGDQGIQGIPGVAAGFGTPTATVDDNVGTPGVTVQASGPDTAKVFSFAFVNLKGETGAQGEKGDTGDTGPQGPEGPQGPKGDTGTGLDILGTYDSLESLQAAVQSPSQGDMYNVGAIAPYTIYMWDITDESGGWESQGQLQGPQGPAGEDGAQGPAGADGADATINGVNALTLQTANGISSNQSGGTLTIKLPDGGDVGDVLKRTATSAEWGASPSGLPTGGTPGQMLYQGASGPEWGDKPVMYVNITGDDNSGYQADKTFAAIQEAYQNKYAVFAIYQGGVFPLYQLVENAQVIFYHFSATQTISISVISDDSVYVDIYPAYASDISFTPGTTGLTSDNVQDAIEEVNEKIPNAPKSVSITLPASGWSSNTQTVTVQGVKTSGQSVRISPATKTDADNWVAAGVWCSEPTTANQLVFTCDTAPTENININVELQEVQS